MNLMRTSPYVIFLAAALLQSLGSFAQAPVADSTVFDQIERRISAVRTSERIAIDAKLNESSWLLAPIADKFTTSDPQPGLPSQQRTEVRFLYDDEFLYVGAKLYDTQPDSINLILTKRDDTNNADWFGLFIDAYNDDINAVTFVVTAAGVQFDEKVSQFDFDPNWNAVWNSATSVAEDGWIAEFAIPYSAIRFPTKDDQEWGINLARSIRRTRETSWWNPNDPSGATMVQQAGVLEGISDIVSPVRLQLTPYVSAYVEARSNPSENTVSTGWSANGGADIKYGINDAFTLDMTLIPDFGQVRFDNQVLNLSPFEVFFDENRPFFTEGTELFNKAGLFYSRRVGGTPSGFWSVEDELDDGETIERNPSDIRLINATKVSGRTDKGLGIGVFNAVTASMNATINTAEGGTRQIETEPLTNYSVIVLDQNLKNSSTLTFTNTNVMRSGDALDANVTGLGLTLQDKENKYRFNLNGAMSQRFQQENGSTTADLGHTAGIRFSKVTGNFQFGANYYEESDTYNPNDLGFLFNNNERSLGGWAAYNIFKFEKGKLNRMFNNININYSRLYDPNVFTNFVVSGENVTIYKNFFAHGVWFAAEPITTYDYFEPGEPGRYYTYPVNYTVGPWISTDYRRTFALDVRGNYRNFAQPGRKNYVLYVSPRWQVNERFLLIPDVEHWQARNQEGNFDFSQRDTIIFGRRNVKTTVTGIRAEYIFNNLMSLNFRLRHYWSSADYYSFHLLSEDGFLVDTDYDGFNADGTSKHDVNFNAFTIDMVYTWRFAPGSDIILVWKNAIFDRDDQVQTNYFDNLQRTFRQEQSNNFSIKIVYFLDYLYLKKWMGS